MSDHLPPANADEPIGPRLCQETCEIPVGRKNEQIAESSRASWLHRFEYHPPFGDQAKRYAQIRAAGRAMVELLIDLAPDSPERHRSLEALQQSIMFANAAIACNESPAA